MGHHVVWTTVQQNGAQIMMQTITSDIIYVIMAH